MTLLDQNGAVLNIIQLDMLNQSMLKMLKIFPPMDGIYVGR